MRKTNWGLALLIAALTLTASGCNSGNKQILNPKKPVVVTFWHSYNTYAKSVLDDMILEFNDTVGTQKGIIIDAYGYGEQKQLETALYNSANKVIGAEQMPDMFISYPDNAQRLNADAALADLSQYLSEEELGEYRQEFLMEGIFDDDEKPKMIPVAKSTELVFINDTDWKKFAAAVGRPDSEEALENTFGLWEEIVNAAQEYYQWSGGKPLLGMNLNNDMMYVLSSQLGETPYEVSDGKFKLSFSRETAKKIWDVCYIPHMKGWFESAFYNQDEIKSGRIIAYIGSSAGAGFFPSEITIDADSSYPINCSIVSYPFFEGTTQYMAQRGANIAIVASDLSHEYAAAEFIKWFTAQDQSIKFTASTGYIPVKNEALENEDKIFESIGGGDNREALNKSIATTLKAAGTRKFVTKKPFEKSYEIDSIFSNSIFDKITLDLEEKNRRVASGEPEQAVISQMCGDKNFDNWYDSLIKEINAYTD